MNERIRELATKARLLTGWPVGEVEYQKFAELIVQECLLALEPDWYGTEIEYEFEQRFFSRCSAIIKKHFGLDNE